MVENYIATGIINLSVLGVLTYMICKNTLLKGDVQKFYMTTNFIVIGTIVAELVTVIAEQFGTLDYRLHVLANCIGFTLSPIVPILLAMVFRTKYFRFGLGIFMPSLINGILVCTSPLSGWVFSITPDNSYVRGSMFGIYIIAYAWGGFILVKTMIRVSKYYYSNSPLLMPLLCGLMVIGTSIQIVVPSIHTTWLCVTFSMIIYYGFICEYYNHQDMLTTLWNRAAYENAKKHFQQLEQATVIVIDIRKFKEVNDTYGHQYGDYCLTTIGGAIRESFLDIGLAFRIGGDEFCVLSEVVDEAVIQKAMYDLLQVIEAQQLVMPQFPNVDMGYKIYDHTAYAFDQAFEEADKALYRNKKYSIKPVHG